MATLRLQHGSPQPYSLLTSRTPCRAHWAFISPPCRLIRDPANPRGWGRNFKRQARPKFWPDFLFSIMVDPGVASGVNTKARSFVCLLIAFHTHQAQPLLCTIYTPHDRPACRLWAMTRRQGEPGGVSCHNPVAPCRSPAAAVRNPTVGSVGVPASSGSRALRPGRGGCVELGGFSARVPVATRKDGQREHMPRDTSTLRFIVVA